MDFADGKLVAEILNARTSDELNPKILELCRRINERRIGGGSRAVRAAKSSLFAKDPVVQLHALTLLDALARNCSNIFHDFAAEHVVDDLATVISHGLLPAANLEMAHKIVMQLDQHIPLPSGFKQQFEDSRRKGPHFLGCSSGPFHRFSFHPEFLGSASWDLETIFDSLYLQVQERLEDLVGTLASELLAEFDSGIGRLVWRDSLVAWLLPLTFIIDRDKCNSFGLFLLSPKDAAPALGIDESTLADWMTLMLYGLAPGYPLPWAADSD